LLKNQILNTHIIYLLNLINIINDNTGFKKEDFLFKNTSFCVIKPFNEDTKKDKIFAI
jgi:hypothetical protein